MKKIYIFIFVFYSIVFITKGQQPWANEGATWYYSSSNGWTYFGYLKYEKTGDTLINGINCDNFLVTQHGYDYYQGVFLTDTIHQYSYQLNNVVYRFYNNQFIVLYDYNALPGDTWTIPDDASCDSTCYLRVDSLSSVIINKDTLNQMHVSVFNPVFSYTTTIIEKTGGMDNLFPVLTCKLDQNVAEFRCYSDNSGWSYIIDNSTPCDFTTGINGQLNYFSHFFISPNPAANMLTIHTSENMHEAMVSIMNAMGQETSHPTPLLKERGAAVIDVSGLAAGIYFVEVRNEKERWVGRFVKE